MEFKSPSKGVRASDLLRLVSYGVQYHAEHLAEMASPAALTLVLVAPAITQALLDEIAHLGWRLEAGEDGYAVIVGAWYTTYAVFTNQAAAAEHDDYLGIFSNRPVKTPEATNWFQNWIGEIGIMQDAQRREGHSEMLQKLLETLTPAERIAGLAPEDLRAALTPEERLIGLSPEEQILALSNEVLRGFSEEYVRSLPAHVQQTIRERLGKSR